MKDATEGFRRHELSKCHQVAIQVMIILPRTVYDVGESQSSAHAQNKAENRRVLLKILQNVKFLGRQGIAFRGHDDAESNFMQLFNLQEVDYPLLSAWLKWGTDRYLSPDIPNKMLQTSRNDGAFARCVYNVHVCVYKQTSRQD